MTSANSSLLAAVLGAAVLSAATIAGAATLTPTNASFESPTLSVGTPATTGSVSGWGGSSLNTVFASSYGLTATHGAQVAYLDSPGGNNGTIFQTIPSSTLVANTVYTVSVDLRPLVNDPANNAASVTLSDSGFTANMAEATFNSAGLAPGGFASADEFTLTAGQWTRVTASFNTAAFPSQVAALRQIVLIVKGHKIAVDNVRMYVGANTYYLSESLGDDANDGLTVGAPWKSFGNLRTRLLSPGDNVLLRRGDAWTSANLTLRGKGTAGARIGLSAYGTGPNPVITGQDRTTAMCITYNNASYVDIDSMDCRFAKVGLYLRYQGNTFTGGGAAHNNQSVTVRGCNFEDMNMRWSDAAGAIAVVPPYELSWGAGIWLGGEVLSGPPDDALPVLTGLTIEHTSFQRCSTGFGDNWYYPAKNYTRLNNVALRDCWATGCENGGFALFHTSGGDIRRFDTYSGGLEFYNTGTTNGFIETCKNLNIDDCDFGFAYRNATGNDGVGFDFEGDCDNIWFTNNVVHDCDGGAILILTTSGFVTNSHMQNNTFYNNGRDPKDAGQNREWQNGTSSNTGSIRDNGVYRGNPHPTFGLMAIQAGALSPFANFTSASAAGSIPNNGNRTTTNYAAVSALPRSWDFTGGLEGWSGFNQWGSPAASGGFLTGTASGVDPYVEGPATWANARLNQMVRVRMSVNAGATGQVFFQTETYPTFTGGKSVAFPLIADGVMREYLIDMRLCAEFKGVLTRLRVDPTDTAGAAISIDRVEILSNPIVRTLAAVGPRILDLRFNEAMLPAGGVLNPANYAVAGPGRGTCAATPDTVTPVTTPSGVAYRLGWNSGGMVNGSPVTVTVSNAVDALGNAVFPSASGSAPALPAGLTGWELE